MANTFVPNSTSRQIILAGTEAARGVAVVPDYRWRGDIAITRTRAVNRAPEATGTRDRLVTPNLGRPEITGTYSEQMTYQSLGQHGRYWLEAGDPAVADAGATVAYTRAQVPGDVLDSATLQYGFPGLGFQSAGVFHNEGTITFDFDDNDGVWKFSSTVQPTSKDALPGTEDGTATAGSTAASLEDTSKTWTVDEYLGAWVTITGGTGYGQQRQVESNTATTLVPTVDFSPAPDATSTYRVEGLFTAGIPTSDEVKIATPGTKVYIDPVGGTIGTRQILNRMISGNITVANALAAKWFLENEDNPSAKVDEGDRIISGQLQMEFDRRDEYEQLSDLDEVMIRIEKEGPVIDATAGSNYLARIDVARALWTDFTPGTRANNITATFAFDAYVPAAADILTITTVTPQAALY